MEEKSISIINRNNGPLTGERAEALPIKLTGDLNKVRITYFLLGILASFILFTVFVLFARKQVTVVDVSGKANNYQEYQLQ